MAESASSDDIVDFGAMCGAKSISELRSRMAKAWNTQCADRFLSRSSSFCELKSILKYRLVRWLLSSPVMNIVLHGQPKSIHLYECSFNSCTQKKLLRMTPSGVYCEKHYICSPRCSTEHCYEPCIERLDIKSIAGDADVNMGDWCRLCEPELADFDYHECICKNYSPLALAETMTVGRVDSA